MTTQTEIYVGGRVFDGERLHDDRAVVVRNGLIHDLVPASVVDSADTVSFAGQLLTPGFVDLQVNGGGGVLLNDSPTAQGLGRLFDAHRKFGTTAMLPTLISDEFSVMSRVADCIRQALASGLPGIVGVHFEGPYLNRRRRGIHPERALRPPEPHAVDFLTAEGLGRVMVTLAPEAVPTEFIRTLAAAGVVVSIGHTSGDYRTTRTALTAGARSFTHAFNAMTPLGSREPGVVGAALEDTDSFCGIIVDGHHVHPVTLQLALRAKTRGRVYLVTDGMPSVGSAVKEFRVGGQNISVESGRCTTPDGTLAGSNLDMASAVRNSVDMLGLSLEESLRMASLYPASLLGDETRGRIAPGYRADFCLLDAKLQVRATSIAGQLESH